MSTSTTITDEDPCITVVGVTSIQGFVFASNRLQEAVGGSLALVEEALHPDHALKHITTAPGCAGLLFSGGGNAALRFNSYRQAKNAVFSWSNHLLRTAPGLRVAAGHAQTDGCSAAEAYQRAREAMEMNGEAPPFGAPLLTLPVTRTCSSTGLPACRTDSEKDRGTAWISSQAKCKRDAGRDQTRGFQIPHANAILGKDEFAADFAELGGSEGSSMIGVVHVDGNEIGSSLKRVTLESGGDWNEFAARVTAFSGAIREASDHAMLSVIGLLDENLEGSLQGVLERHSGRFPLRPIVHGGDDITFVCDGRIALALAAAFLRAYAEQTAPVGGKEMQLSACAGVAIVPTKFPVARAYAIAEELCAHSKGRRSEEGGGGWLDFQLLRENLAKDLTTTREQLMRSREPDGGNPLALRPYRVTGEEPVRKGTSWGEFCRLHAELSGWKRSHAKGLLEALTAGTLATKKWLQKSGASGPQIAGIADEIRDNGWFGGDSGQRQTPIFDPLDVLDFGLLLDRPEAEKKQQCRIGIPNWRRSSRMMTSPRAYTLRVELRRSVATSSGQGQPGGVDRDIVYDALGLPILTGRRVKGLWRDAYRDVRDAFLQCSPECKLPFPDQLFGAPGQLHDSLPSPFKVENGYLEGQNQGSAWISALINKGIIHREQVMHCFTDVRRQTAIDRRTSAAKHDSLRQSRILRAGLVFEVPVYFEVEPSEEVLKLLGLSAPALRYLGASRTRGVGRVSCSLVKDVTQAALQEMVTPPVQRTKTSVTTDLREALDQSGGTPAEPTAACARYRLTLQAPAVIPVIEGDPNTLTTRDYIPGSQFLGAAAWKHIRERGRDDFFWKVFVDGSLVFLNALPEHPGQPELRLHPLPHSFRHNKETGWIVDLSERIEEGDLTRLGVTYGSCSQIPIETFAPDIRLQLHHQRPGDRRAGRPLGGDAQDGGAFFGYESLEPGGSFIGAVVGSASEIERLQALLPDGSEVNFGRSKSAEYGGRASVEWLDAKPLSKCPQESDFRPDHDHFDESSTKNLVVTLMSPMLARDPATGHPAPRLPLEELASVLGVGVEAISLVRSFVRTEVATGYQSHLRLPLPQWPALAPGSVFVLSVSEALEPQRCQELETRGLGYRRPEGYGRLVINRLQIQSSSAHIKPARSVKPSAPWERNDPNEDDSPSVPPAVVDLLVNIHRIKLRQRLDEIAEDVAGAFQAGKVPSNSLLSRLQQLLMQNSWNDARAQFKNLKGKPAEKQLRDCRSGRRIPPSASALRPEFKMGSLHEVVDSCLQSEDRIVRKLAASVADFGEPGLEATSRQVVDALAEQSDEFIRDYLRAVVGHLRLAARKKRTPGRRERRRRRG